MFRRDYEKNNSLLIMLTLCMFVTIGVVISPILRFEGFAPTAHFVNIVCSVFLGPWYSLLNGLITAFLRMSFLGIPPLAITGQILELCFLEFFIENRKEIYWQL